MSEEAEPDSQVAEREDDAVTPIDVEEMETEDKSPLEEMGEASQEEMRDGPTISEPELAVTAKKSREKEDTGEVDGARHTESLVSNLSNPTENVEARQASSTESANLDFPMAPKSSRLSYDGATHYQHKEARGPDLNEALYNLVEDVASERDAERSEAVPSGPPEANVKTEKTYAFSARWYDEKKTMAMMRRPLPRHDFFGYVYSSESPRPFGLSNYFLPIVPQPCPRKHIAVLGAQVPFDALHPDMRSAPKGLLPLSAVHLKWRSSLRFTVYTLTDLYAYLRKFGPIESIYRRSPNSAVVLFCELASARNCVKCPSLGMPWDIIVATWCEPRMHNQGYMSKHLRMEEYNNMLEVGGPKVRD